MTHDRDFLSFEEAVVLTRNLEDYFNSPASDDVLEFLRERFNLSYKDGFVLKISNIVRNHHECTGCNGGSCVAGCYMSHTGMVSYWDKALTKILGAKLVVHEVAGHAVYEQIFDDGLSADEHFERSEEFAQYMEDHFNRFMKFMVPHNNYDERVSQETLNLTIGDGTLTGTLIEGFVIALGAALATIAVKQISKKIK